MDEAAELRVPRRVDKPWGYELIWAETELYVGKILHVLAGEALSLQYHEEKDETLFVLAGEIRLEIGPLGGELREIHMTVQDACHLPKATVHRMTAITDCDILEASTPHLEDVVRLDDRYGRVDSDGR